MLSHEDGMPAHGRLPAVVGDEGGSKPPADKVLSMAAQDIHPLLLRIFPFRPPQMEAGTEGGTLQEFKNGVVW